MTFPTLRLTCGLFAWFAGGISVWSNEPDGAVIYRQQCARCHGTEGQGTERHGDKLIGELSPGRLTAIIHETMPEDKLRSLSEADAAAVAKYVHTAFYSSLARERNRAARVELSRLTVRQYRQSVAEIIQSFRTPMKWSGEPGLRAKYYDGRHIKNEKLVHEQIDPRIDFQFADQPPLTDKKIDPFEFSIVWRGSLLAPDTGEYEFLLKSEHGVRLFLNDDSKPFLDGWIRSGDQIEHRGRIYLLAGRVYRLRVEYSKGKTGVDDPKLNKKPKTPPPSSISLQWRRPQREFEPIAQQHLSTEWGPEQYVIAVPFPPDDRSYGWERGTAVSKEWDLATTEAAIETTLHVLSRLNEYAGTRDDDPQRTDKLKQFCRKFAERAFRRPLPDADWIERQFPSHKVPEEAVKRCLLLTLKSPFFLYRETDDMPLAYRRAAHLSFALWDSGPDEELRRAAAANQLSTTDQLRQQIERMLRDSRSHAKLREFLLTWLNAERVADLSKDSERFPGFDEQVRADLRTSLELTLDRVLKSPESDFRLLVQDNEIFLNGRLARYYGVDLPADAPFQSVPFETDRRAGVLTHPYLMASFSHSKESSPIHRGVFLARGVLGVALKSPPEAVAPLAPELHPDLTTRERVEMQTKATVCMTCHSLINPLGFTLENFDAVGKFRDREQDKPIDTRGTYRTAEGKPVTLDGANELAAFVLGSDEAHRAFVQQLFHHLLKQSVPAYGPDLHERLLREFTEGDYSIRRLTLRIVLATMPGEAKPPADAAP